MSKNVRLQGGTCCTQIYLRSPCVLLATPKLDLDSILMVSATSEVLGTAASNFTTVSLLGVSLLLPPSKSPESLQTLATASSALPPTRLPPSGRFLEDERMLQPASEPGPSPTNWPGSRLKKGLSRGWAEEEGWSKKRSQSRSERSMESISQPSLRVEAM